MVINVLLILIAILLLLVGTALFLYLVIRRSRKVAFVPDATVKADTDTKEPSGVEFLQHTSNVQLRTSFRRALRVLKTYVTGRDYRYRAPWYLLAGESKSGKTSLLDFNGLNVSVKDQIDKNDRQLNWYFFDDGVVLDVAGDFVLRPDGTASHRGWNTIMRLLQKHRPQRPLDGLVLAIPCTDLVDDAELTHTRRSELEQKANCLYKKLWQAQRILGMRLPVYVVVTKCDEITGFTSFCRQLPQKLHTQMFGWSNPSTVETAYKPEFVTQAFESLHKHLSWLQFEIFAERDEIEDADDLFLFPSTIQSMRESMNVYLDCLFKQSAYHESYIFRGLYFCGEGEVETNALLQPAPSGELLADPADISTLQTFTPVAPRRKPIFLADLFKEKIFGESSLAQPIRRIALSRNRTVLAAQVLSLLILIIGGGGLASSYNRLVREEEDLYRFLAEEENDLKTIEAYRLARKRSGETDMSDGWLNRREQLLEGGATRLLTGMANMNVRRMGSVFIPSSWFSGINQRLETSIAAVFKFVIFESLRLDMSQRAKGLLSAHPQHAKAEEDDAAEAVETAGASSSHVASDFQLSLYVEELGDFRINLERYNRLVGKDPDSLNGLRQLITYLGHTPLPANFDKNNHLYDHAMFEAQGRPIDSARFYKESATRVSDLIEDFYAASFNQKGVTYGHLNDIAETEALLSRPEYTWLSTYVFDPHSPFHGMTLSTGLGELRKALQDLRREEFMAQEPADYETSLSLPQEQPRYQHYVRRVLVWDQEALQQAIALYDQYEDFVASKSYENAEYLDNSVKQAARTRLKTRMSRLFRQARKYQALAPATEGSALRSSLITEVKNLQEVQPTLSRVLQVSATLGIDGELRSALSSQVAYLLRGIQREFVGQQFYSMKNRDFSWWYGNLPVAYVAYDLASAEDLNAYLALQRKNIAFLARDLAVPVLTFSASHSIHTEPGSFDWNEILTDLDAFDNKLPGNPIGSLETFILTDMDKVNIDSCSATVRLPSDSSRDYFLRIRNGLRLQFYRRCTELARIKRVNDLITALGNYREIEESFNQSLSGGFPFTDLGTRPDFPDLDPWELMKFYKLFDAKEKAAREALARSSDFGATPAGAIEFLDQMARVREFFAPFLEKKQGPMLDFGIQFRVNREEEIGANQIIDWKLDVGKKKFSYLSDDLNGRWIFGDPVRLTLRWANDSPTVPVTSATPAAVKVKDRVAVFEYNDRWSLFTFLLKHGSMLKRAGTPAECDQGFDSDPYTLKFSVRTDPDPAARADQRSELKSANADVFMRMSLMAANKQDPLMIPCFPKKAPPVPALSVSLGDTNLQEH